MQGFKNPENGACKTNIHENEKAGIMPLFLNRREIAHYFNVSENKAREILAQNGIMPIDLGKGRGNGLRWRTSAVIELADILHAKAQARSNKRRIKISPYSIRGKSAAQLFAEFQRSNPADAEACNGN